MRSLPTSLAQLEEHCSRDQVLELVRRCGGTRVYVPLHYSPSHLLDKILGQQAFEFLIWHYGGGWYEVPTLGRSSLSRGCYARHQEIREARKMYSAKAVALMFGFTTRQIRKICARAVPRDVPPLYRVSDKE